MTKSRSKAAQTIQIFLPYGEPRGLRIAEITTRIVQAIQVPRTKIKQFVERQESGQPALYILFGGEGDERGKAYIGQTEDTRYRLKLHNANKDFWNSAVVVISRTQSFTQAHIKYLEWLGIQEAKTAGRFQLENSNEASKPHVPEPIEADILDTFETIRTLVASLGFPIFDVPEVHSNTPMFFCKGPDAEAKGIPIDDGFLIYKGGLVRTTPTNSAQDWVPWYKSMHVDGLLEKVTEDQSRLTSDFVANSPSYAAAMVLAKRANGWRMWKTADGKTLHDVYRKDVAE